MIKDIGSTAKHTVIYGLGNLLVKIAGLLLIPLYTSALSTSDYGMLILLEVTAQFLVGVLSFRIPGAMLRFGTDATNSADRKKIYFTALVGLLAIVLLAELFLMPSASIFSRLMFDSDKYATYFIILFASVGLEILGLLPLQLMRLLNKPQYYISFFLAKLVATLSITYYLITSKNMGVEGAVWGMFTGNAMLWLASLPMQIKHSRMAMDKAVGIEMFKFGAPLIFTSISTLLLTLGDRVIIKYFGELSDVGIYGFAYKIGSLVNLLVINSFSLGFLPIAYKKFKDPDFKDFFKKTFTYFMLITVVFTIVISLFGKEAIKVISSNSPDYWEAVYLVPLIAFAFVFKGIYFVFALIFHISKKTKYAAWVTLAGMLINLALNFALIPVFGIYGAVFATLLSFVAMSLLSYKYGQNIIRIDYELKKIALMLTLSAVVISAGFLLNDLDILYRITTKSVLLILFVLALWKIILNEKEKKLAIQLFKKIKTKKGLLEVLKQV